MGLLSDFSGETLQVGGWEGGCWKEVFEVMKGRDLHPTLLCSAKLSFGIGGGGTSADGVLPRYGQVKEVHHHQALII